MNQKHYEDIISLTLEQSRAKDHNLFRKLLSQRIQESCANHTYKVAYQGELLVGFIRWSNDCNTKVLDAIVVADGYQGLGHVEGLWNSFLMICRQDKTQKVVSYTEKNLYEVISLHENLGFKRCDVSDNKNQIRWEYDSGSNQLSRWSWLACDAINDEI